MLNQCSFRQLFTFTLFAAFMSQATMAQEYDVVILNGRVMDPETMFDAVRNVGIKDGRIAAITKDEISGSENCGCQWPCGNRGIYRYTLPQP